MLGKQRTGIRFTKCSKIPCDVPNTAVHQRHTLAQDRGCVQTGCSNTPHGSALYTFDPNRRPYTTERLLVTQNSNQTIPNVVQSTKHRSLLSGNNAMFQLVFQVQNAILCRCTDFRHKSAMHRRHSQNCDEITRADGNNAPNTHRRTDSHVPNKHASRSVRLIPSLPLRSTIPSQELRL